MMSNISIGDGACAALVAEEAGNVAAVSTTTDALPSAVVDPEQAARDMHAAYREHFSKVNYEPFRECWIKAAGIAGGEGISPAYLVEVLAGKHLDLDPEELASEDVLVRFRKAMTAREDELIEIFNISLAQLPGLIERTQVTLQSALGALMLDIGMPSFRVVLARKHCNSEQFAWILKAYGKEAAEELRWCPKYRAYIQRRFPRLDIDALIKEAEKAAEEDQASRSRKGADQ